MAVSSVNVNVNADQFKVFISAQLDRQPFSQLFIDTLDLSKIEAGKSEFDEEVVNLRYLLG